MSKATPCLPSKCLCRTLKHEHTPAFDHAPATKKPPLVTARSSNADLPFPPELTPPPQLLRGIFSSSPFFPSGQAKVYVDRLPLFSWARYACLFLSLVLLVGVSGCISLVLNVNGRRQAFALLDRYDYNDPPPLWLAVQSSKRELIWLAWSWRRALCAETTSAQVLY